MNLHYHVLFICGGVGGAEMYKPIIDTFQKDKEIRLSMIGLNPVVTSVLSEATILDQDETKNRILLLNPDLVITDRSNSVDAMNEITRFCNTQGIYNICMLDLYGNYEDRFKVLADKIFVPSEKIKNDLVSIGLSSEKLIVTGNPAFDALDNDRVMNTEMTHNWLFVSQPLHGLEFELLKFVLLANENNDSRSTVYVKPHPLDSIESWRDISQRLQGKITLIEDNDFCVIKNASKYDIAFGYNSTILLKLSMLGLPVYASNFTTLDDFISLLKGEFSDLSMPYTCMKKNARASCVNEIKEILYRNRHRKISEILRH